jgi:polyisoprenoid-binding protein YceI
MKARPNLAAGKTFLLLLSYQLLSLISSAQVHYTGSSVDLVVSGTSTLHDWTMKSVKADCNALFLLNPSGNVTGVQTMTFSTPAIGLKSDHTGMDNNAYKALKTDKNPTISYTLTSATVAPANNGQTTVKCTGNLSIAGATKEEEIVATCKLNADNTITVTGSRKISMPEFSIVPPTFMLGAVKTGSDVVITFTMLLKRS